MKIRAFLILLVATVALYQPPAFARPHQAINSIEALDEQIRYCLEHLAEGRLNDAGLIARQIARRFPDFELGQLIAAEMDSVRALRDVSIADHLPMAQRVSQLLLEARKRLAAQGLTASESLPDDLIQIGKQVSSILLVDLNASVLSQYKVGSQQAVLVRQHYVGSGEGGFGKQVEGDLKTPLGVYNITGTRSEQSLPDLYGSGALMLDYPNDLDRLLGRTGYGIWLHGVPSQQRSRTPYSSEGCVTMSNAHLSRLLTEVDPSTTKVILTHDVTALEPESRRRLQRQFHDLFTTYQEAQLKGDQDILSRLYDRQAPRDPRWSDAASLKRVNSLAQETTQSVDVFEQLRFLQAFSDVSSQDISIFRHRNANSITSQYESMTVTEAVFGALNQYQLTIYWARSRTGDWHIMTETLTGPGM